MFPKSFEITYLPSYIVCAVGIVANMMLLIAFIKDPLKCFRNSATYLVGNLALSDLMYCVAVIASVHGNPNVNNFFRIFAFYVSIWTIFSIAVDRHTMITYPLKHRLLIRRKKMAMWIAFVWIVSSVHPILGAIVPEKNSNILKPGTGVVLIILTGILYAKTYFSLKKQARLMAGKKITFSRKCTDDRKNECGDKNVKTCVKRTRRTDDGDKRVEIEIERGGHRNNHVGNHIEPNDDRIKRDRNQIEQVEDENKRVENRIERDDNRNRRVECHIERVEDRRGTQNSNDEFDILARPTSSQISSASRTISFQSFCFKASNNANEQKFLNTIIIIAVIAAVTVFPATIYGSLTKTVFQSNRILHCLFTTILSLNFAANPFVYYLRLKQYRKTFKILYGCKGS